MIYNTFRPGQEWLDTSGKPIQAHGGSVLFEDGIYYWYGENKEHSTPGSGIWHWGIRCYSSRDLYNWDDRGLIIPPVLDDETSALHPSKEVDRPHIVFNEATGLYVCWIKVMEHRRQRSTVLTSRSLLGPYEIVRTGLAPAGMSAGDFDLAIDPVDGKGYYYFERPHSELICADLTEDYTDVTGFYSTHFPRLQPPFVREAPAYFRRDGVHYLITSGTTWYYPNRSEVASAPTQHGPWTVLGDPHPSDDSGTSFRSQVSSVFRHPHRRDLYIALADRWLPDLSPAESDKSAAFTRGFRPDGEYDPSIDLGMVEADTSRARYVWLPIDFGGRTPTIEWQNEWSVDDDRVDGAASKGTA